jgi:glutamate racemase
MSLLSASNNSPIGVFDSGVGGLPILKAIHRLLPNERLVYLADTGYAPYGDKIPVEVVQRVLAIGDWFAAMGVKAMVVACNTASVLAIDVLRARCGVPIIGVEPAIKPAALASRTGVVGVLATARTAASASVARLVDAHGQHNNVRMVVQACPGLVDAIEGNAPRAGIKPCCKLGCSPCWTVVPTTLCSVAPTTLWCVMSFKTLLAHMSPW